MELRELGTTGVKVPEVGPGTWEYRGGVAPLRKAVDLGAFLIDTAEIYGTEGVVGEAIRGVRDRVFVATKVSGSHLRRKDLLKAADGSLKRLGIDRIDLYQVHWPDHRVPIAETMGALEDLVDAGKVRYIGVSNFSVKDMEEARKALRRHPLVSNQVLYSLEDREIERDVLPYCQQHHITVLAYSPLARGALVRKAANPRSDALFRVAREAGRTPAQVALNWCLSRPWVITIPKSDSVARTEENCAASGWRLSQEHVHALDTAFA